MLLADPGTDLPARGVPQGVAAARLVFGCLVAVGLLLFVAGTPSRYRELLALARSADAASGSEHGGATSLLLHHPFGFAVAAITLEILFVFAFSAMSSMIVWRRTREWTPLLFAATFVMYAVWVTPTADALELPRGWWPLANVVQGAGLLLAVLFFLLFPDGRFVPPWTRFSAAIWVAYTAAWVFLPSHPLTLVDPFEASVPAFLALMLGGWGVGLVAQSIRYRRAANDEQRTQTRIVLVALLAACLGYAAVYVPGRFLTSGTAGLAYGLYAVPVFWLLALPLPIALTIAILRHRLFGVSAVLARAIVFGFLAAFITLAYVAIVVGIGSIVGHGTRSDLALSVLATAAVAVAFQPVRTRAQRVANRMVYGRRATPYEVLVEFARRVGDAYAIEDLLPETARVLAQGTDSARADIWLRVADELRVHATWPADASGSHPAVPVVGERPSTSPDVSLFLPVHERGELLGALSLTKPPDEPTTRTEEALARDLASQAGLVLRNVRLTEELRSNVEELRASRQRIVSAQDQERRRIERNIHDGAQQRLVALAMKASLAQRTIRMDPEGTDLVLEEIRDEANEALEELRDLARGIYPPLLADEGLRAALTAQARKTTIPTEIRADGLTRYPQEVEAAVYFCVLECMQNATKYAQATSTSIDLRAWDGWLRFSVTDDGVGFDTNLTPKGSGLRNMTDRLDALGGTLQVRSTPGRGTVVEGRIPLGAATA